LSYFKTAHPDIRFADVLPLSRESYSLYISIIAGMIKCETKNGLKGQYNIAQGKRSVALGLESGHENRPRGNINKRENLNSDEMDDPFFSRNDFIQFRPKGIPCFVHRIHSDGFSSASFTQGGVSARSSRNSTLGYDILAFQAGRNAVFNLCIKSSSREGQSIADARGE